MLDEGDVRCTTPTCASGGGVRSIASLAAWLLVCGCIASVEVHQTGSILGFDKIEGGGKKRIRQPADRVALHRGSKPPCLT